MTIVRRYLHVAQAEMDKSLLELAGIKCFVGGENSAAIGYGTVLGEINLQVEDEDAQRAGEILEEQSAIDAHDSIPSQQLVESESATENAPSYDVRAYATAIVSVIIVFAVVFGNLLFKTTGAMILLFLALAVIGLGMNGFYRRKPDAADDSRED